MSSVATSRLQSALGKGSNPEQVLGSRSRSPLARPIRERTDLGAVVATLKRERKLVPTEDESNEQAEAGKSLEQDIGEKALEGADAGKLI